MLALAGFSQILSLKVGYFLNSRLTKWKVSIVLFFKKKMQSNVHLISYLVIWLYWVLVAACETFQLRSVGSNSLARDEPQPPPLGREHLINCTTRETPQHHVLHASFHALSHEEYRQLFSICYAIIIIFMWSRWERIQV